MVCAVLSRLLLEKPLPFFIISRLRLGGVRWAIFNMNATRLCVVILSKVNWLIKALTYKFVII